MKVLKFGGTSVGSVESILSLKRIAERQADDCVVVVSALGGVTDKLIQASRQALEKNDTYLLTFEAIKQRHHEMVDAIIADKQQHDGLLQQLDAELEELRLILFGVHLIKDLSPKSQAAIVSYGERLSSRIVATLIPAAVRKDSLSFIKTHVVEGKQSLDSVLTNRLIVETFAPLPHLTVCPGFISTDSDTEEITNLGRGGSDYTAAIIAAALDAEVLEIWTDVNGFMTADPRVISSAYTIDELSYVEATELCNFGAKVVYPPTIYPVCVKNIPIRILNTFDPENPGTVINAEPVEDNKIIRGISSIRDVALITVSGLSMVGVIGVNRRIFTTLAQAGVSVFLVSQASSENSTSLGVPEMDCDKAVEVLNREFAKEIEVGSMYPVSGQKGLAAVSIVGEKMAQRPDVAGRLFSALGRNGIDAISFAQGAHETNISFIIPGELLRKTMNVLHDSFFLSENNVLNLFVCGVGTVGGQLLEQIRKQADTLLQTRHLRLNVVGVANSRQALLNREGIDLATYREQLKNAPACTPEQLLRQVVEMNIFNSVFVDCTASATIASLYQPLLEHNVSVVAANKIAASSEYATYSRLKKTALNKGVKFLFETNVGAGLPIIGTINDLRNSGDSIHKIEAVVSGTLNYIFNELSEDVPFSETIHRAKVLGFSEPDPRIDLSGKDVIRKLVILAREAGRKVEQQDVHANLFLPQSFFDGSLEEFWQQLPSLDAEWEKKRKALEAEGKRWRFVATLDGENVEVALRAVDANHPFYHLEGANNIVLITTDRYNRHPLMIQGYGAGADVTAAGVFANIMSIANV